MTLQEIITLINTVGFPIVCCIALFWLNNKNNDRHQAEIDSLKHVIENNTNSINVLSELIKGGK